MRILRRTRRFLTSRSTVLAIIVLLTGAMLAAVLVRQTTRFRSDGSAEDVTAEHATFVRATGLDHVFSTWWFAGLGALFIASLVVSTGDQLQSALARTRHLPAPAPADGATASALPREEVERVLAGEGYRRLASAEGVSRWVRFWPGYWGNFLLHLGMTVTVAFALVYVLTEHRAILRVVSGPGTPVVAGGFAERSGLLATRLPLPDRVTLVHLEPSFREGGGLSDLSSVLALSYPGAAPEQVQVAINAQRRHRGALLYQLQNFGKIFDLVLEDLGGERVAIALPLPAPLRPDEAGYGSLPLAGGRLLLKAKYYADAARASLAADHPQLVLRLQDGDVVTGEAVLEDGGSATLGRFTVRLAGVRSWTDVLVDGSSGTTGIFAGFALLLLGGALTFLSAPREVILRDAEGAVTVSWRTQRFADMYAEERDRVLSRCAGRRSS